MNDPRNDHEMKQMDNGNFGGGEQTPYMAMEGDSAYSKKSSMEEVQKGQIVIPEEDGDGDPDYINFSFKKLWIFTGPGM